MKEISIKDIAKLAGVAPSTVSLVLNDKAKQGRISDAVAEKIRILARENGYKPNQVAVSLRTGSSKILGLIIEDISNAFFASIAKAIEDEAEKYGYRVLYCSTENNTVRGNELVNLLFQRQVDGYLISPTAGMENGISDLLKAKQPVVLIDRYFPTLPAPYVLSDNIAGASEALEYFIAKGHRNIGLITSDFPLMHPQQRESAYTQTLIKHNIPVNPSFIYKVPYTALHHEATQLIADFIKSNAELDAIFFTTNYLCIHGLGSINQLGMKIPDDIAVICFDDHDLFKLYKPAITAVKQNVQEIAETAMQFLMHQITGNGEKIEMTKVIATEFIIRDSV
ncbi:LacI family transcriptional regulator [Ilyomonas limi]|uniref:LacI family transcriptional regulator n=1 Tax=Ilyomonas limi TaxID=2575867 RepID=A0A4U3KYW4_9BACT|nr:substrate-binding domain-containing protein [Ilyomonas limi]TKK67941.1 LacI family transcriptional regulator [Ilyomonas limi]